MNRSVLIVTGILMVSVPVIAADQKDDRARLDKIEQSLKADVPRVLCLDDSFATGGQPTEQAFAKVAASGFRSVLSLRGPGEGIDLNKERALVEKTGLRYFNIPVISSAPRAEQADEFIRLVKEKSNHPMLIHCSTANRVGAFMMIYRVLAQGWSEQKALDEALKIGLRGDELKKFAQTYIAQHKAKHG
ncbi:MAG TPA: protein tyrosine phosphatase family protein [Candidatus Binatia bacterium]|nr:protein tyrosine phosphatase family protein [Candidatus Binatia bacterium]